MWRSDSTFCLWVQVGGGLLQVVGGILYGGSDNLPGLGWTFLLDGLVPGPQAGVYKKREK